MPYLFVSHNSACEALRTCGTDFSRWPDKRRFLPLLGDCVTRQREFADFVRDNPLDNLGIITRPVDILVPARQRHKGKQALTHPWSGFLPVHGLLRMGDNVLVSTPEFAILQLAHVYVRKDPNYALSGKRFVQEIDALKSMGIDERPPVESYYEWAYIAHDVRVAQVVMEFAGTYRLPIFPDGETFYRQPQLTTIARIWDFMDSFPYGDFARHSTAFNALKRLLPWTIERSASPMETTLVLALTLPVAVGGYGLPKPELNAQLDEGFGPTPDLLWRGKRLVVEYDSHEFHQKAGNSKVDRDVERANTLRAMGYTVLEVTPGIAFDAQRLDDLAHQIAALLGIELEQLGHTERFRRGLLMKELFRQE